MEAENFYFKKFLSTLKTESSEPEDSLPRFTKPPSQRGFNMSRSKSPHIIPIIRARNKDPALTSKESSRPLVQADHSPSQLSKAKHNLTQSELEPLAQSQRSHKRMFSLDISVSYIDGIHSITALPVERGASVRELKLLVLKQLNHFDKTIEELEALSVLLFDKEIYTEETRLSTILNIETKSILLNIELKLKKSSKNVKVSLASSQEVSVEAPSQRRIQNTSAILPTFTKPSYDIDPPLAKLQAMAPEEL